MARVTDDIFAGAEEQSAQSQVISINGQDQITLPNEDFIQNADILRDGQDLLLQTADGQTIIIEGYFNADPMPVLTASGGETLTPQLVYSFVKPAGPLQYADNSGMSDESPVGAVQEIAGSATVTRTDGTTEQLIIGSPIYEGDIVETAEDGAVEISFIDETSFAVSQNAKLAIDEYVFDPATESGSQDFSVLRGLFVFTSGLVGRDDPDDVNIDTPMGSIGIRGTIIVGNADTGEVTVMEGAIVVRGLNGTEITLSEQFATARFEPASQDVSYQGKMDANGFETSFESLKPVAGGLFSSVTDGAADNGAFRDLSSPDAEQNKQDENTSNTNESPSTQEDTGGATEDSAQEASQQTQLLNQGGVNDATDLPQTTENTSFDGSAGGAFDGTSGSTFDNAGLNTSAGGTTATPGTSGGTASAPNAASNGMPGGANAGSTPPPPSTSTNTTQTQPPPAVTNGAPVGTNANAGNVFASNGNTALYSDGSNVVLNMGNFFTDPNSDAMTYSITGTQQDGSPAALGFVSIAGASLSFNVPNTFTVAGNNTQLQVTVQATDISGNAGTATFTVDVLGTDIGGTATNDAALASSATGDVLNGFAGDDGFTLGHNAVTAFGGIGNDTFNVSNGIGHFIEGGAGSDTVDYSSYTGLTSLSVDLSLGSAVTATYTGGTDTLWYIENIVGTAGNDTITGSIAANTLSGGAGNDMLRGLAGDDTLNGGAGDDTLRGDSGIDTMNGNGGDDRFIALDNDGNDIIDGGTTGETAGDWYDASNVTSDITVDVANTAVSYAGSADSVSNVERFTTGSGNDTFLISDAATANTTYDGGAGTDTYDASARAGTITVDASAGTVARGGNTDNVANIERFLGGTGADIFTGSGGNDYFDGGAGADVFNSSAGADTMIGAAGVDLVDYSGSGAAVNIDLAAGTASGGDAQGDMLSGIENITGSGFDDTVRGNNADNTISGGAGNDILRGSGGTDTFDGGTGTDTLDYSMFGFANAITLTLSGAANATVTSAKGNDTVSNIENIIGTQGDDTIYGDANNNVLRGGAGNDTLGGNGGANLLEGEAGDDTLIISNNTTTADGGSSISGDTLEFNGTAAFTLDENNVIDVETIDAANSSGQQDINLAITSNLLANDTGDLIIDLDGADTLNLTFSMAGFSLIGGDVTSAGFITYSNSTNNITVNYSGGSAVGRISDDLGINGISGGGASTLNLTSLSAADGFYITDDIAERFGNDMTVLGDINNDGYSDIAFTKHDNADGDGRVFFMNGGNSLSTTDLPTLSGSITPNTGLLNATATSIPGDMQIDAGGDFNGDGINDYIVSSDTASTGATNATGAAQIIDGSTGGVLAEFTGMGSLDYAGSDIAFIGDINGDGLDDVAVGIKGYGASSEGAAFILNGSSTAPGAINVTDPFGFNPIGSVTGGTNPNAMAVSHDGYAYVLDGTNALRIFNVQNPGAMTPAGTPADANLNGTNKDLVIHDSGDFLYALVDDNLTAIDISTPTSPVFNNFGSAGAHPSSGIAVDGNTLVVIYPDADGAGAGTAGGIRVFDITDPMNPLPQNAITPIGGTDGASEVIFVDDYAVIMSGNSVTFVDVHSNPTAPAFVDSYAGGSALVQIAASKNGDITYAIDSTGTLTILDSSNPGGGITPIGGTLSGLGTVSDITVHGELLYVTNHTGDSIYVIDTNTPGGSPQIVGTFSGGIDGPIATAFYDGTLFAIGELDSTLQSFDAEADGSLIQGSTANQLLGTNITDIGDYNNDGFDDFAFSSPGNGEIHIAYGNGSGMVDMSDTSTINGFTVDASNELPVISLGDVDGDGVNDIAAASTGGTGILYVFAGQDGASAGANNPAGTNDAMITAASGFEIIGSSAAGDFNGDGFADIAVAMRDTTGAGDNVHIYVLYGNAGLSGTYSNDTAGNNQLNDTSQAFHMTYQIQSHIAPTSFEINLEAGSDLNGDGFADLLIGLPQTDTNLGADSDGDTNPTNDMDGKITVVYGRETSGFDVTTDNEAGLDADATAGIIAANASGDALVGSSAAETLADAGHALVNMSAGAGDDSIQIANTNVGTLDGGGGFDTMEFLLNGGTLDFTALGDESFKNIEEISMDATNQTVVLGLDDVFDMMETSTQTAGGRSIAQLDSTDASNIYVIESNTWSNRTGILADNDGTTFTAGEGSLDQFGNAAISGSFQTFDFGSGYELWINDMLINAEHVVIARNVVVDADINDADPGVNGLGATADKQSLIGTTAANNFSDQNLDGIAFFGFEGDDFFEINNEHFHMINGGSGNADTINFQTDIDLSGRNPDSITGIEVFDMGIMGANTMTLTNSNIITLLQSSDTNSLTINSNNAGDILNINDMGAGNVTGVTNVNDVATALGGTFTSNDGTYNIFDIGGSTVNIDQTLFDGTSLNIL